ncbi:putative secreted protein (Por secretion system target) [Ulvibacter sp. MAR_2010_11]|uniref:GEVED domain-containing protein n=1 Tax=Ulvibacter sp. MAR_2010_11 TaxID=1250229 RepID=UPI000C2C5064|nr:GEVED domain-containing protein [Ulvibacter sp. MAR_2010_11]PKA83913.1 putative secreted protein (Por secretion system target) [Ulvibacter sp. MAR_2010_11]
MKPKNIIAVLLLIFSMGLFAQEASGPTEVIVGTFIGKTIPLRDYATQQINENIGIKEIKIVPNKSRYNAQVNMDALPNGIDTNVQREAGGISSFPLEQNFIGFDNTGFTPPDPTGAVGPNHYVHSVNSSVKIFDKTGNLLVGPVALGTFLGIPSNAGDPIVLYDQLADRYFVSEFGSLSNSLAIGVSDTNDPTGAYNVYQFALDAFPDYPHYSVWPDGYYLTANKGGTNKVYAIERDVILAGGAGPQIVGFPLPGSVQNTNTVYSPEPANLLGTTISANTPGYIVYLQDDGWAGVAFDHLKVWEIDVDWSVIGNSTISAPLVIPTDPFNSVFAPFGTGDVAQPGTAQKIDMIGGVISFATNYRGFGSHNSMIVTFNTDIDGNDTSGIRWIELRNDGILPWSIHQEGTYAPADGHSRFMGSAAMDAAGNIGLGFNIASATLPAGIRYTGRFDGDPLGMMTVAETTIVNGVGVQTFSNRFGDYSHLTMDPNNFTFWHTAEYFSATNQWRTQVASFSLSGGFTADVGVSNIVQPTNGILSNAETVEVSIRNFGTAAQSNIPLELRVDGNLVASEVFAGTINGNSAQNYTFTQTVDLSTSGQTYAIEARTNLVGDQFATNDPFTKNVTHLLANDVGVLEITSPVSGSGLSNAETVSVTIKNFGAATQSNVSVVYTINGGADVVETFVGPIASEQEVTYNFTQTADLSALGTYNIHSNTSLAGDMDSSNDEAIAVVENILCQPNLDCSFGDGFQLVSIAEINNPSGCEGYGDFTAQIANLDEGTHDITFTTGYGDQHVKVWIDFNDDSIFTNDEVVVPNFIIAPGQAGGSYTETVTLTIPVGATVGAHRMRAKSNWQAPVPIDACEVTAYGETEDYTANIGTLGIADFEIINSEIIITSIGENIFDVSFRSDFDGIAFAAVYNMLGQQLGVKLLDKEGDAFKVRINMSQAASGIYLIRVGGKDTKSFKTARIIVK